MYIDRKKVCSVLLVGWLLALTCGAWAQTLIHSTDWTGGAFGSTTAGGAGTNTGAGDGWVDIFGGDATGGSQNKLLVRGVPLSFADTPNGHYVLRPTGENVRDSRLVAYMPPQANAVDYFATHRYVGNNTSYLLGYSQSPSASANKIQLFRNVAGSLTQIGTTQTLTAPAAASDQLRVTTSTVGTSPVVCTVTVYDVTTATQIGSYTASDSSPPAALQGAGQTGMLANTASAPLNLFINRMDVFDLAASSASISTATPTTLYASRTTTVTLTGVNTHWSTSAPTATVQNTTTTATAGAVTVISDTQATVPVTTNGVSGSLTLTLTNATDGALVSPQIVVNAALYTRVDATDAGGQAIMLLIPNANSAVPYNAANPTRFVIYFHGAGEDQTALLSDSLKTGCVNSLLNAGYILAGSAAHSVQNWGNQPSVDDYAALWQYVTSAYNISRTAFWGQSMGGLDSLLSLAENKIPNVVGWLGTYPVCSLANLYSLGSFTSNINAAYGITGSGTATYANLTVGHDPVQKWGWAFRRVTMRIYASYGDTVVPRTQNTDVLNTLVTGSAPITVITCTGNHGDPSHFVASEYLAFFNACFASPPAISGGGTTTIIGRGRRLN